MKRPVAQHSIFLDGAARYHDLIYLLLLDKKLVAESDVLVENFRPGILEKWNLGWEQLSAVNPKLVMLMISGFAGFRPCPEGRRRDWRNPRGPLTSRAG